MRAIIAFALCMLACAASSARVLNVGDLLGLESYGQVVAVPGRDLMLVEHRRAYDRAADFGYDTYFSSRMVTRIMATAQSAPGRLEPLFPQSAHAGYWIGSLSPEATRVAVFRLEDRKLALGVVDIATRSVRWLPVPPDLPAAAPGPAWIGEERLVYVAMTGSRLPASLSAGTAGTRDLERHWSHQAAGGTTRTLVTTRAGAISDDGHRQVLLVDLTNGKERTLARGDVVDAALSPSGRHLAVVSSGEPVQPPPGPINTGFDSRRNRLQIVDTSTGRQVTPTIEVLRGVMSWSSDDRLLVVTRDGGADWKQARWTSVDPVGRVRRLGGRADLAAVDESVAGRLAYGGWAGTSPVALVSAGDGRRRWVRMTDQRSVGLPLPATARTVGATPRIKWMLDAGILFAVDRRRVRIVERGIEQAGPTIADPYSLGFRQARDPAALALIVRTAQGRRYVQPLDGTRVLAPIEVPSGAQVLATSGEAAIMVETDRHAVSSLSVVHRGEKPLRIASINDAMSDVELPRAIDLATPGGSGAVHHDWLLMPATTVGRPALIVNPYPGLTFTGQLPREAGISRFAISDNALLLVSAGFAVLLPSMPTEGAGNPADTILPRIDEATDAAVATGLVDGTRIGLQGHSFGGYTAMTVATRSSRYKAIVAANGPYDLIAMHGNMPPADKLRLDYGIPAGASIGWTEGGQGGFGAPPDRMPSAYLAASPIMHVDRVTNPVLLIAGDLDPVDATQAERAFMELYRHGKDATLARYWGEGHTNASPGNIRDYWQLIVAFFDEHLRATPEPGSITASRH